MPATQVIAGITAALVRGQLLPGRGRGRGPASTAAADPGPATGPAWAGQRRPRRSRAAVITLPRRAAELPPDAPPGAVGSRLRTQLLATRTGRRARGWARAARDELDRQPPPTPRSTRPCRILRPAHHPGPARRDRRRRGPRQQISYKGFPGRACCPWSAMDREARPQGPAGPRGAAFPRPKRLEDFDYAANPNVPAALIATLGQGRLGGRRAAVLAWSATPAPASPNLLIGLGTAAAENGYRVRYRHRGPRLVNESSSRAADDKTPGPAPSTRLRAAVDPALAWTKLGYLELDRRGAELLFQVFHRTRGTRLHRDRRPTTRPLLRNGPAPSPTPGSAPPSSTGSPSDAHIITTRHRLLPAAQPPRPAHQSAQDRISRTPGGAPIGPDLPAPAATTRSPASASTPDSPRRP